MEEIANDKQANTQLDNNELLELDSKFSAKIFYKMTSNEIVKDIVIKLKKKDTNTIDLYNYYMPYFWLHDSIFTVKNKYQEVRTAIKESTISAKRKEEYLNIFKIDTNILNLMNSLQLTKTMQNSTDNTTQNLSASTYIKKLRDIKKMIIEKNVNSVPFELITNNQKPAYLLANLSAIYVAMNTGRRQLEIFSTLEVKELINPALNEKSVYYSGLAKKRGINTDIEAFLLDYDYDFLKQCIRNIRAYYKFDNIDSKKFNSNYQGNLNKFVRNIFKDEKDLKVSYKVLRDFYQKVAIEKYKNENVNEAILSKAVLGHEVDRLPADFYYQKTKIEIDCDIKKELGK